MGEAMDACAISPDEHNMLRGLLVASAVGLLAGTAAFQVAPRCPAAAAATARGTSSEPRACAGPDIASYDEAEARGFELYKSGEFERAIRMFELAQTLPGDGVDYKRQKSGGMIGSATAPPNPREWGVDRFATAEQKLIAQYNIACCCAAMGDGVRATELIREYIGAVGEPLNQVNEMLVDPDLLPIRDQLRGLRDELKSTVRAHTHAAHSPATCMPAPPSCARACEVCAHACSRVFPEQRSRSLRPGLQEPAARGFRFDRSRVEGLSLRAAVAGGRGGRRG